MAAAKGEVGSEKDFLKWWSNNMQACWWEWYVRGVTEKKEIEWMREKEREKEKENDIPGTWEGIIPSTQVENLSSWPIISWTVLSWSLEKFCLSKK